ncbi:MAG TPA: GNAT family N-acetyltransferase [Gaiellaceae bacterium]|nr:GNAT family N-acetyltransferase [Gaiellaceae bacterium]
MDAVERGELEAFRSLYAAAPAALGAQTKEVGDALALRLDGASEVTMFNRVLGLGLDRPASEEQLDAALAFLDGVHAYVAVAPDAEPPELARWLEQRGHVPDHGWTKFSRPAADPPRARTQLRVERVDDGEPFADAAVRGFGEPLVSHEWLATLASREGWHCFVAFDGVEPAGAGALFVLGDLGWVGIGATKPQHRGKGAQSALLAARIAAAAEAGCSVVVTETGEPVDGVPGGSYRNIVRAGFAPRYVRANYVLRPAAS